MPSQRQIDAAKFHRDQTRLYRDQYNYGLCQVSYLLRRSEEFRAWQDRHCLPGLETDHIYGRHRLKCSWFCGLILVQRSSHNWKHDGSCRDFHVGNAYEVCALKAKHEMHVAESRKWNENNPPPIPTEWHWAVPIFDEICGYSTFCYRLEMLQKSLANSPYVGLAESLLENVE